jgi:hypothetical protein
MGKYEKILQKILAGTSDNNIKFSELRRLLNKLGFEERIRGDYYIFTKDNVEEIINIQPKDSKAKGVQPTYVQNRTRCKVM